MDTETPITISSTAATPTIASSFLFFAFIWNPPFKVKLYQKINVFLHPHYTICTTMASRWKNTQTFFCAMGNHQAEIDKI